MISFQLSDDQRMLKNVAHQFAEKEIKPVVRQLDAAENPADCFSCAEKVPDTFCEGRS